ncbi:MAG TPA: arginine--tRNA ligase [Candidatus Ozemobacteraceae bacterium]|nr:arginine--tRNA ligase [Candidatus Ozemobacteraceae bacterium]
MKKHLLALISSKLTETVHRYGVDPAGVFELQTPPDRTKGDFALNTAMRLAKPAKKRPLELAEEIAGILRAETAWFARVEVAPPGFVNLFVNTPVISRILDETARRDDLGLRREDKPQTVVVDYSSVNIAKQMHVGHLRSTIIGDVLSRVLEARGETVIRQNHLGDWGLPIAMVLWKACPVLRDLEARGVAIESELTLARLEGLYREASAACKEDPAAASACHEILVKLQNGDAGLVADWHTVTRVSMAEVYRVYDELRVKLAPEHERGESFYRDRLAATVEAVRGRGKLVESQGAQCVFLEHFKAKDGSPLPVIIQKSDGGFNYETFDLAAIRYRVEELGADRVIYVTDARQALHFAQVFDVAAVCGWTSRADGSAVKFEHVPFGSVLGEDNKPLKTRTGENVKLSDLLAEAVERAYAVVCEKNADLAEETKRRVAKAVGIGAIKYADLSQNRNNDYVFSFDRMLALQGNTAPYLQYAHARICSIFRKGGIAESEDLGSPDLVEPAERALGVKLLEFADVVTSVESELRPHTLCTYLYDLATAFSAFYDQCPVLIAADAGQRRARLALCRITRRTLALGLDLLGIEAPQEM